AGTLTRPPPPLGARAGRRPYAWGRRETAASGPTRPAVTFRDDGWVDEEPEVSHENDAAARTEDRAGDPHRRLRRAGGRGVRAGRAQHGRSADGRRRPGALRLPADAGAGVRRGHPAEHD